MKFPHQPMQFIGWCFSPHALWLLRLYFPVSRECKFFPLSVNQVVHVVFEKARKREPRETLTGKMPNPYGSLWESQFIVKCACRLWLIKITLMNSFWVECVYASATHDLFSLIVWARTIVSQFNDVIYIKALFSYLQTSNANWRSFLRWTDD